MGNADRLKPNATGLRARRFGAVACSNAHSKVVRLKLQESHSGPLNSLQRISSRMAQKSDQIALWGPVGYAKWRGTARYP